MDTSDEYVSSVTLMILGEDLDPDYVSRSLDLLPSQSWRRGEEKGLSKGAFYEWGGWKLFGGNKDSIIEEQIDFWLGKLEGKDRVFKKMNEKGWECSLNTFLAFDSVATLNLNNRLLTNIADLGLDLDICLNADEKRSESKAHNSEGCAPSA